MPEIDFAPENKRANSEAFEFDRLKLKKDERARVVMLEKPTFAWVHTLKAPKIVNGKAVKVERETRRGEKYWTNDLDYIGRPLCAGDYGIITDNGADPQNCPICKRASETDEVSDPERRFAVNVVRYAMNRDFKPVTPFACQVVVWPFTDKTYNTLVDIATEGDLGLRGRDLILKCTNEPYQNYDIQGGAANLWQSSDAIKDNVLATYQANKVPDLERACGRKAETRWMMRDLETIAEKWRVARGEKSLTDNVGSTNALNEGLDDLLGSKPGDTAAAQPATDMTGLLGDGLNESSDAISNAKPRTDDLHDLDSVLEALK